LRILIDTNVLIWDALLPEKLSDSAKETLNREREQGIFIIADISLWNIARLMQTGYLKVNTRFVALMQLIQQANNLTIQPITPEIAHRSVTILPELDLDVSEKLICATADILDIPLVTAHSGIRNSDVVETIW